MDCSMSSFPVRHQLPELAQTHVHQVGNAIQPTHPLSSPSPPALNLSQHQGLFQWVSSLHQVAKALELQHQSFQWIFRTDFLWDWLVGWISLLSKGPLRVFSSTTVQKHKFSNAQLSVWSNSHIHTWLLKKTVALTIQTFVSRVMSLLFNMLSKFVIAFLPRRKRLLISWLQPPSAVILEPQKIKSDTVSFVSPSIYHEVMGLDAMTHKTWSTREGNGKPLQYSCLENPMNSMKIWNYVF